MLESRTVYAAKCMSAMHAAPAILAHCCDNTTHGAAAFGAFTFVRRVIIIFIGNGDELAQLTPAALAGDSTAHSALIQWHLQVRIATRALAFVHLGQTSL